MACYVRLQTPQLGCTDHVLVSDCRKEVDDDEDLSLFDASGYLASTAGNSLSAHDIDDDDLMNEIEQLLA